MLRGLLQQQQQQQERWYLAMWRSNSNSSHSSRQDN
jgi:hypothetical protein